MTMLFHSTRGGAPDVSLREVALSGMAPDGGLYLPKEWPVFSSATLKAMRGKTYAEIAFEVLCPFMAGVVPDDVLKELIQSAYRSFDTEDVVALYQMTDAIHLLELFHGPTLAFKDLAMQFLGNLFEFLLSSEDKRMTIVGATSGDTGSAAISALANRRNINVFILYPSKGPSDIQRRQMTCVDATNVHALAVDASFDECQAIVKELFTDPAFRDDYNLSTVNSINLVRILTQVVYYFVASSRISGVPCFVVPTGNFGDVFAGYAASRCGLPISKLVVASNSNDSLTRFFASGRMEPRTPILTLSPSMDIQISSNFERLLFDLCGADAAALTSLMGELKTKKSFSLSEPQMNTARALFCAGKATDQETIETIATVFKTRNYLIDPHTAVGIKVANDCFGSLVAPIVCLSTAHAAKFPDTVLRATGNRPDLPDDAAKSISGSERLQTVPPSANAVKQFVKGHS